jgi:hypothetical protein
MYGIGKPPFNFILLIDAILTTAVSRIMRRKWKFEIAGMWRCGRGLFEGRWGGFSGGTVRVKAGEEEESEEEKTGKMESKKVADIDAAAVPERR